MEKTLTKCGSLYCLTDLSEFDIWKQVTDFLIRQKPVTREQAVKVFQSALAGVWSRAGRHSLAYP